MANVIKSVKTEKGSFRVIKRSVVWLHNDDESVPEDDYCQGTVFIVQKKCWIFWAIKEEFGKPYDTEKQLCGRRLSAINYMNNLANGKV